MKIELQNYKCMYCKDTISLFTATLEHVNALSHGGEHYLYNVVFACWPCNRGKGQVSLKTFCERREFDYHRIKQEMADINHQLHILVFGDDWSDLDIAA